MLRCGLNRDSQGLSINIFLIRIHAQSTNLHVIQAFSVLYRYCEALEVTDIMATSYSKVDYDNPKGVRYLPTTDAYNLWAEHYDHDGNFLQKLDTLEMQTLFPHLLEQMSKRPKPWKFIDLGCGTGRNTFRLLDVDEGRAEIVAVDASPAMMEVAKKRIAEQEAVTERTSKVSFDTVDLLSDQPLPAIAHGADAVVSTLVLEHIPCQTYFEKAAAMLSPGGLLLMTNMHGDMGKISQAGFVDPKTGEKIRPTSYAHTVEGTVSAAEKSGFSLVGTMKEVAVNEGLVEVLGARGRKWIGVYCWYGGLFMLK